MDATFPISIGLLVLTGKIIKAGKYGGHNPQLDIPMLLDLYSQGRLDLDGMVTKTYSLEQIHQAFDDMENNLNARGVILFN